MEDINTRGSTTATIGRRVIQPGLIIQALAFTGILYFCVGQTPPTTRGGIFPAVNSATLSAPVSNSVLQHASRHSGLPTYDLRIVHAQPQNWSDDCLGLSNSTVPCIEMSVPGWQVTVASRQDRWVYRTNTSGSVIKLEGSTTTPNKERKEIAMISLLPTEHSANTGGGDEAIAQR